jgi:hypothetical protein
MINRMLVVVFDTAEKAYEGTKALFQLENEGGITWAIGILLGINLILSGATR